MCSFGVLGMSPITFLSDKELPAWGNDSLEILIKHYGHAAIHTYKGEDYRAPPMVDAEATRLEWRNLKALVKLQQYPRDSTAALWSLIVKFHRKDFPNLIILASLAMSHPIHTADCERTFSSQNTITTALRNRLGSDTIDQLMRVHIEGQKLQDFDFIGALQSYRTTKTRVIFQWFILDHIMSRNYQRWSLSWVECI